MSRATYPCMVTTSRKSGLYSSGHTCWSVRASISCAVIRTLSPERATEPSTTASTLRARAISARGFRVFLYCIADVREITRSDLIFARLVVSSSVMPSAKYSWLGSPERFSNGSTAKERMGLPPPLLYPRQALTDEKKTATNVNARSAGNSARRHAIDPDAVRPAGEELVARAGGSPSRDVFGASTEAMNR